MDPKERLIYHFADVLVDVSQACVKRGECEQHLRQQTLQVLLYLLEQHDRLVTKEELLAHIWPGTAVTDDALVQCVSDIRRALGDDPHQPRFIKTIPKLGYRFIGLIEESVTAQPANIEIEETFIEVEFEEEVGGEQEAVAASWRRMPEPETARVLPPAPVSDLSRRIVLAVAGLLTLALAVLLPVYLILKPRPSGRQAVEIALPRVAGKKALAVMYFENQSQSADLDWLREGLADMLITDLSRSAQLNVLGRQQLHLLLERMGHDPESNVRLDEALDVARHVQAEVVALGSFARLDGRVRVEVELYDTRSGAMLAAESIIAEERSQILTQIDLLSLKIAAHLGATPAERNTQAGLASIMTDNLEAYRYYSLAVERAQGYHNADAIALLKKAVALDPQFAMAYARIGYAYAVTWHFADKAKPYLEKAFRLSDRLTEKDRLYITAWYSIANLDYAGTTRSFQEITTKYPLEIEAYVTLYRLLMGEERREEAAEVIKQALSIDAGAKELYNALGSIYSELGRHDEAVAMFRRYVELAPDEPNAHDSLGMGYQWAGRYPEAMQEYERALALDPKFEIAIIHLGNAYFQQGRYREAIAQFDRYIQTASSDVERARGYDSIAFVQLKKGDLSEVERMAKKILSYEKLDFGASFDIALERGDVARAARLLEQASQWPYTARGVRPNTRALIYSRGCLNLKRGDADEAVEDFKEALRQRPPTWNIDPYEDCLANAYLEVGRFDEAITEYDRILRLNPNYPLAHYHLAQAYEQEGRQDQARAEYEHFLKIWSLADPDIPEVRNARAKLNL